MNAIMGITGQIGGVVARALLASEQPVRAVVRDAAKGQAWSERGCEVALATIDDAISLAAAFRGAESVFVLVPANFDPLPEFPEAQAIGKALHAALVQANPARVVYLSTIGAQANQSNLLTQHTLIEKAIGGWPNPVTFLRPAWFMENSSWDLAPAREQGVIPSFLQPLDKPVPMVGTADIGKVAAELHQGTWKGHRVVELEGPERVTPNEIAATFARLLGRPVRMETVPRGSWEALFKSQGMKNPIPRIRMLDGFNEGWIDFEHGEAGSIKGKVSLETVLNALIKQGADVH
jgi:NAD(P)H dehydrogenase (quinone)